jgi:hypothetical protein
MSSDKGMQHPEENHGSFNSVLMLISVKSTRDHTHTEKRKKQNHLVVNVAVKKIIHCATSPPEEDGSTSEECQHLEVIDLRGKGLSLSFNTEDRTYYTCYGFNNVQESNTCTADYFF